MKRAVLLDRMDNWDRTGRRVFTLADLRKIFPEGGDETFSAAIRRFSMDDNPILKQACRGVYVNIRSRNPFTNLLEEIARTVRRGHHSYISLESALSEYGRISQIPIKRITVVTTGRSAKLATEFGVIELNMTRRNPAEFIDQLIDTGRPLRMASEELAEEDLLRYGRNCHMLIPKERPEIDMEPEEIFDAQF